LGSIVDGDTKQCKQLNMQYRPTLK